MSWTTRDVRCPDGHYECSVVYNTNDGPPPCPHIFVERVELNTPVPLSSVTCNKPRTPFWATREMEGKDKLDKLDATLAQFGTVTVDGRKLNREELARFKADYAANQGGRPEDYDFVPVGNRKERADEHRHRAVVNRRRAGYDEQDFRRHQRGEHR